MALETELFDRGKDILAKELVRHRSANSRMKEIAMEFPDVVRMPSMRYPPFESPSSLDRDLPTLGIDKASVQQYANELRKLADEYNLRCDWIVEELHHQMKLLISRNSSEYRATLRATPVIDRIVLDIPINPDTRKKNVLRQVEREWQRVKANPEFRGRQRPPKEFDLSVIWLARRLYYNWNGEKTACEIEHKRCPGPPGHALASDVDSAVKRAAKFLGIRLPRGRPPKGKKR